MIKGQHYEIFELEDGSGPVLVPKIPWNSGFVRILEDEKISALRLSYSAGWKEDEITFWDQIDHLKVLEIYTYRDLDLSPISSMSSLVDLSFDCKLKADLNFTKLTNLRHLFLKWSNRVKSVDECINLESLNVVGFNQSNFDVFSTLHNVKSIALRSRKIESLDGISQMKALEKLDLYSCSKLSSIEDIIGCQHVNFIDLESCKKIYDLDCIGNLRELETLLVYNCSKIKSMKFKENLRNLKKLHFSGDSTIEDCDLSFLANIDASAFVFVKKRRSYRY